MVDEDSKALLSGDNLDFTAYLVKTHKHNLTLIRGPTMLLRKEMLPCLRYVRF